MQLQLVQVYNDLISKTQHTVNGADILYIYSWGVNTMVSFSHSHLKANLRNVSCWCHLYQHTILNNCTVLGKIQRMFQMTLTQERVIRLPDKRRCFWMCCRSSCCVEDYLQPEVKWLGSVRNNKQQSKHLFKSN